MSYSPKINTTIRFNIYSWSVGATIIYCVLFPADHLKIKEIILVLALLFNLPSIISFIKNDSGRVRLLFYSLFFPFILTMYALLREAPLGDTLSYGYVWIFLLLIPAIVYRNMDVKRPFIFATILVAIAIDFIYLTDVIGIMSIYSNPLVVFLDSMNELQYGKGILSTFGYSIFYKSSPLLFLTYGYMLNKKRYLWAAVLFLSFLASGTRANFLMGLFLTVTIPVLDSKKLSKKAIITIFVLGAAFAFAPSIIEKMTALNAIKYSRSEAIKFQAIQVIFDVMKQNPLNYIFGTGVGSSFYFPARGTWVNIVEVSYFDYFRQVGIVGMFFFIAFLVRPIKKYINDYKWLLLTYVAYLAVAFTNPLLVTSTAFMVYVLMYSGAFLEERQSLM